MTSASKAAIGIGIFVALVLGTVMTIIVQSDYPFITIPDELSAAGAIEQAVGPADFPGTDISVEEVDDNTRLIKRTWLGMVEISSQICRSSNGWVAGSVSYGIGSHVKLLLFVILPAGAGGALAGRYVRRSIRGRSAAAP